MKLLSVVTFLPLIGTALLALIPRDEGRQHKAVTLLTTLVTFFVSLALWAGFDPSPAAAEFQFEEFYSWIPSVGIGYHVGIDGVALLLVMGTARAVKAIGGVVRGAQNGDVQRYAAVMAVAAAIILFTVLGVGGL